MSLVTFPRRKVNSSVAATFMMNNALLTIATSGAGGKRAELTGPAVGD